MAEPVSADDFQRQAAERVTPIGEYLESKTLAGLEATRPVEAFELGSLPSRYAADEYGLMPPGPPPADLMSKEQFDSSPYKRPGLEYEEGETEARAAARAAVADRQAYRDSLIARSDAGYLGQAAGFGLSLGTAALDPTNYVPLLGPASKAAMVARFGRIGGSLLMHGSEAALNTGLFEPLAAETARVQGRGYGWEEAGADILTNALGGAVLGTAVGEGARLLGFGGHAATRPDFSRDTARPEAEPLPTIAEPIAPPIVGVPEAGAGVVPRRAGQPPLRVDDLMRRADAANLALDQIDRGEPVDVGKVLANDPALRTPAEQLSPAAVGDVGQGIVGGMYDMLHERYSRGETTEAGGPSLFLQVAKAIDDRGRPLTREEFPALAADVMTARKAGSGPEFQAAMRGVIDKWAGAEPSLAPRRAAAGEDVAITSAGRRVPVAYEVVEAHALVASHTEDMRVNPAFPAELQPRDRTRAASGLQVGKMASNLEPALLGRSATASEGAPIVGPDGVVESGNARVLAIGKAFRERQPGSAAYRRFLVEEGHPEAADMEAPVLVRRRTGDMTPDERAAFTREANVSGVAAMGTAERAAADAAALKPEHLELLQSGDMHAVGNRPFVRAFLGTLPEGERAGLMTAGGELSRAGAERVRNAVLARAYGDADLVARLAEEPESGLGTLGRALTEQAPAWARLRAEIDAGGAAPEGDGTAALLEAVHAITAARDAGNPLHFALGQGDLLEAGGSSLTADGRAFLTAMLTLDKKGGSRLVGAQKLGEMLAGYVDAARKQPPGKDMFGTEPMGPAELLAGQGRIAPAIGVPLRQADFGKGAIALALGRAKLGQPSRTLDGLYENAAANQALLVAVGREVAEATGTRFVDPGVKGRAKSEEKIERKGYKDARQLTDVVRGGFMVRTAEQADAVVRELGERQVLLDEGWNRTDAGYFDRKLISVLPDGTLAEVQLLEPHLYEVKETKGHLLYDEAEKLPTGDPRKEELLQQQRVLYSAVLAEVDPSVRGMVENPPAPRRAVRKVEARNDSERTYPLSETSEASTSVQPSPGASTAQAREPSITAGRPSQSTNLRSAGTAPSTADMGIKETVARGGAPEAPRFPPPSPEELARRKAIADALVRDGIVTRDELRLPEAPRAHAPETARAPAPELPDAEARQLLAEEQTLAGGRNRGGRMSEGTRSRLDEIMRLLPADSDQRARLQNEDMLGAAEARSATMKGQRRGRIQGARGGLPGDVGGGMSLEKARPEPVPPTLAEAAPRVGKAVDELAALRQDAGLDAYGKPLPGHEPAAGEAEKSRGKPAEIPPTPREKAAALSALPPELQEIEHMRREGVLRPEDEAALAKAEDTAQRAEGYASAWQALASCVLRNTV